MLTNLSRLASIVMLTSLVVVGYTRFEHGGKVCSGDYLPEGAPVDNYLTETAMALYILAGTYVVTLVLGMTCNISLF